MEPHPLDRPAWSSLRTGWSSLARGDARAVRLDPLYGPFGAAADSSRESLAALALLVPADGELWITEREHIQPSLAPSSRAPPRFTR